MKELLQRIGTFLMHVVDAPETAPETRETAEELERDVIDAIHSLRDDDDDEEE